MYRYTDEDRAIIAAARKANKDKRAEKRLYALELRASGKSTAEAAKIAGFHAAYITRLTAKYQTVTLSKQVIQKDRNHNKPDKKRKKHLHFYRACCIMILRGT